MFAIEPANKANVNNIRLQKKAGNTIQSSVNIKSSQVPNLSNLIISGSRLGNFPLQAKLEIGKPDDPYEQEADKAADRVMTKSITPTVQKKCDECEKEEQMQRKPVAGSITPFAQREAENEEETVQLKCAECEEEDKVQSKIQRKGSGEASGQSIEDKLSSSKGSGISLNAGTKSFMESGFGVDFSNVRIHTDSNAVQMSKDLSAQAFTHGSDIYFNSGKFNPDSSAGKHLLAHELTHVIQQTGGVQKKIQRRVEVSPVSETGYIVNMLSYLCQRSNVSYSGSTITARCPSSLPTQRCECVCDVINDTANTYRIEVEDLTYAMGSQTLHDGTSANIPRASDTPATYVTTRNTVHFPGRNSTIEFGTFLTNGLPYWYPKWRILAHEVCGHARLQQAYSGAGESRGNRPSHDVTITTENEIAREHQGPARALFSGPNQGESFYNIVGNRDRVVFNQVDGLHYESPYTYWRAHGGGGSRVSRKLEEPDSFTEIKDSISTGIQTKIQRTIGNRNDLTSPRFKGDEKLEAALDNEKFVRIGQTGEHVKKIQKALVDAGYSMPISDLGNGEMDGIFGPETQKTVIAFQRDSGLDFANQDGIIGPITMSLFDSMYPVENPERPSKDCEKETREITVDVIKFPDSVRDTDADFNYANEVYKKCCVKFVIKSTNTFSQDKADAILGDDKLLQVGNDCDHQDQEFTNMVSQATADFNLSSKLKVFFLDKMDPRNQGITVDERCAVTNTSMKNVIVVENEADRRTLAHEFGHAMLNVTTEAAHSVRKEIITHISRGADMTDTVAPRQCDIIFARAGIQPKLEVGEPDDMFEKEADSMADKVMTKSEGLQKKCTECEEEEQRDSVALKQEPGLVQMQEAAPGRTGRDTSVQGYASRLIPLIDARIAATEYALENGGIWRVEDDPRIIESLRQQNLWLREVIIQIFIGAMQELRSGLVDRSAYNLLESVLNSSTGEGRVAEVEDDDSVLEFLALNFLIERGYESGGELADLRMPHLHIPESVTGTPVHVTYFFFDDPVRYGVLPASAPLREATGTPRHPAQRGPLCTETGRATGYVVNIPNLPMLDVRTDGREQFVCDPRRGRVNLRDLGTSVDLIPTGVHGKSIDENRPLNSDAEYTHLEAEAELNANNIFSQNNTLQRKCKECEEEDKAIQKKPLVQLYSTGRIQRKVNEWDFPFPGRVDEPFPGEFLLWNFTIGSSTLKSEHLKEIPRIAKSLNDLFKENENAEADIEGLASSSGNDKINDPLAQSRSKSVLNALVNAGVKKDKIKVTSSGSAKSFPDTSAENMAKSRGVRVIPVLHAKLTGVKSGLPSLSAQNCNISMSAAMNLVGGDVLLERQGTIVRLEAGNGSSDIGMNIDATVNLNPSKCGDIEFVQNVQPFREIVYKDASRNRLSSNSMALDGEDPYKFQSTLLDTGTIVSKFANDSPALGIDTFSEGVIRTIESRDEFKMYLMFKPKTGSRQTMQAGLWTWIGQARNRDNEFFAGEFEKDDSISRVVPKEAKGVTTTETPVTSPVAQDLKWQTDNGGQSGQTFAQIHADKILNKTKKKDSNPLANGLSVYNKTNSNNLSFVNGNTIQREELPGHDLTAPFWSGDKEMEKVFDGDDVVKINDKGTKVEKIQKALVQLGFELPVFGVDGKFGNETRKAVVDFQTKAGFAGKELDGIVGKKTIYQMDRGLREGTIVTDKDIPKDDFEIRELPSLSTFKFDSVFFHKASAVIPPEEEGKIAIATSLLTDSNLIIEGCTSEEGSTSFNKDLAEKRAKAVKKFILDDGFKKDVKTTVCKDLGKGDIRWAESRRARIVPDTPGGKEKLDNCPISADKSGLCKADVLKEIKRVSKDAHDLLVKSLEHFPLKTDADKQLLKDIFNTDSTNFDKTEKDVKKIIEDIKDFVEKIPETGKNTCDCRSAFHCEDGAVAYVLKGSDAVHFCPVFMEGKGDDDKIHTLIHESHHVVLGKASQDFTYNQFRLILSLSNADAINNADSVAIFARKLVDPKLEFGPKRDIFATGFNDDEKKKISKVLALNQNWLMATRKLLFFTYKHVEEVIKNGKYNKDHMSGPLFDYYMFLADRFDLTKPPAVPGITDKAKLASIFDRIVRMFDIYIFPIFILKGTGSDTKWKISGSSDLTISPVLIKESELNIAASLLQELIAEIKDISGPMEAEYLALIYKARKISKIEPY